MMAKGKFLDLHRHLPSTAFVLIILFVLTGFAGAFIFAGVYNVGADAPHWPVVHNTLNQLRERAIASYSRDIKVPADLTDPKRIAIGAGLYQEMCTGCHLGPGLEKTEMSQGLYPPAPELARASDRSAAEQFWIIKHGVKLSAMPAWGKTHTDEQMWAMVAFVRQLSKMSPEQYEAAVESAPGGHDEMMKGMDGMSKPSHQDKPGSKPHHDGVAN